LIARLIATWFGCGYAPVAPGTAGSLAAIAIAWVINFYFPMPPYVWGIFGLLLCIPGIPAATITARAEGKNDPGIVVVDEVIGQWITLAGATHLNLRSWVLAFALFRILDIIKPPPARQIDQKVHGGLGIVGDDAMAGVYGAAIMFVVGRLNWY
jgi:phosphatidylglycerophosphatase A